MLRFLRFSPHCSTGRLTRRAHRRSSAMALGLLPTLLAIATSGSAWSMPPQLVNFTARNGQNVAYCGPLGGPAVQHNFSTPTTTHDPLSVSHPGNADMPASAASTQFDATPTPLGITLAGSGSATRGALQGQGFGAYAVAGTRDQWEFDLTSSVRFAFSATLSASGGALAAPTTQSWSWFASGGGAQITFDPGASLNNVLIGAGTVVASASGTMSAGRYVIGLMGQADGANTYPYSASYSGSIALDLTCGTMTSYCTAGTTTSGCLAQIQGSGTPSASASSGFALDVIQMEGAAQGLIFYGVSGRAAAPWGTTSSFVCVKSPTQRTAAQGGGGTPGACDGALHLDWNSFVSSTPGALGAPFSAGQLVQAQGWFRDPPSPKSTMLSNAVEFAVCP